jgi:hypothetical protein
MPVDDQDQAWRPSVRGARDVVAAAAVFLSEIGNDLI